MGMQPPAEAIALHGAFQTLSIPKLFIAGIVPGIVMASFLLVVNYIISRKRGYRGLSDHWSYPDIWMALRKGVWSMLAPIIILGGIYTGLFTPTESAVVAIVYTLIVGIFLHKELLLKSAMRTFGNNHLDNRTSAVDSIHRHGVWSPAGRKSDTGAHCGSHAGLDRQYLCDLGNGHRLPTVCGYVHGDPGSHHDFNAGAATDYVHVGEWIRCTWVSLWCAR
ncbi:MAG: TRAP transporter large permease subunit [Marinobacter sp.]|nr:TRAP transporter large permease subunit [Marinobacter sp.]